MQLEIFVSLGILMILALPRSEGLKCYNCAYRLNEISKTADDECRWGRTDKMQVVDCEGSCGKDDGGLSYTRRFCDTEKMENNCTGNPYRDRYHSQMFSQVSSLRCYCDDKDYCNGTGKEEGLFWGHVILMQLILMKVVKHIFSP